MLRERTGSGEQRLPSQRLRLRAESRGGCGQWTRRPQVDASVAGLRVSLLFRIDKLSNFGALTVEIGQVLRAQFLVHRQLPLRLIFPADMNVCLSEAVMRISKADVECKRALVKRNCQLILLLI